MLNFNQQLQSDKVILRPIVNSDFETMKSLTTDANMWYYFTADLSNENILKNWIKTAVTERAQKKSLAFTIINKENLEIVGTTRIGNISEVNQRVEIGWTWIAKKYQGTGINGHVKKMLFNYLFSETTALHIEFKTDVLNLSLIHI